MKQIAKHIWLLGHLGEFGFKRWLDSHASDVLAEIGVKEGQMVLDFGCGSGTYTIPAGKLVGKNGKVYALDVRSKALNRVEERAKQEGLSNIIRTDATGEENIPLKDNTIDVVLLIDVLKDINNRKSLFNEVYRVLRPSGNLTVFPMHMSAKEVEKLATYTGFKRDDRRFQEHIIIFRKVTES
jgi:ubiquinone/menaquinone biosynthesis C-methylase UbiE